MTEKRNWDEPSHKLVCCQKRPLEMYYFIDPLHPVCLDQDPIIKKLQLEYGQYFRLTYVLFGEFPKVKPIAVHEYQQPVSIEKPPGNITGNRHTLSLEKSSPNISFIAIKAAELQGRKAGIRYLKKLQEYYFYKNEDINDTETLISCAVESELDVDLFEQDIVSQTSVKAFISDLRIIQEMNVEEIPTVVVFNNNEEEDGLKLSGVNPYEVYVELLTEMLKKIPVRRQLPPLLPYIQHKHFVTTKEIAIIYNWHRVKAELELKKLVLRREIRKIQTPFGTAWQYAGLKNQ